jgi:DinB superfamily
MIMKVSMGMGIALLACCFGATAISAQQGPPPASQEPATLTSVLQTQLRIVEFEVVGIADAMPEDKYSFAPTNGEFKGVRTFAQQAKHIATVNNRMFGGILGQPPPPPGTQIEAENGPDSIQTKAQIMQYLRDSFALGHKAIATINADNAFTQLKTSPTSFLGTSGAVAIFACAHAMDHYGQMVEYLRDNGLVPPASRQRQPANPAPKQ